MQASQVILVTGANGQLGLALKSLSLDEASVYFADKAAFDITDTKQMVSVFKKLKPSLVINTAAYTQVDTAENNEHTAFAVNAEGVKNLAELCVENNCKLIHLSTDYVFDGKASSPYKETDVTNPVTVYGKSKRAGEEAVLESGLHTFAIIRTSWLYSQYGHNFYKTMLRLVATKTEFNIVKDQRGCPTNAVHLAKAILLVASQLNAENSGIYHYSNEGETTWYDFAKAIFEKHKLDIKVNPAVSDEFPALAKRPKYSVLEAEKFKKTFGVSLIPWQQALAEL